jgi:hypothetical protein
MSNKAKEILERVLNAKSFAQKEKAIKALIKAVSPTKKEIVEEAKRMCIEFAGKHNMIRIEFANFSEFDEDDEDSEPFWLECTVLGDEEDEDQYAIQRRDGGMQIYDFLFEHREAIGSCVLYENKSLSAEHNRLIEEANKKFSEATISAIKKSVAEAVAGSGAGQIRYNKGLLTCDGNVSVDAMNTITRELQMGLHAINGRDVILYEGNPKEAKQ